MTRVEALEPQVKVCMVVVANGRAVQVSTAPNGNAPRSHTFYKAKSASELGNFLWRLESYFGAMGIEDDAQKMNNCASSFQNIALVW